MPITHFGFIPSPIDFKGFFICDISFCDFLWLLRRVTWYLLGFGMGSNWVVLIPVGSTQVFVMFSLTFIHGQGYLVPTIALNWYLYLFGPLSASSFRVNLHWGLAVIGNSYIYLVNYHHFGWGGVPSAVWEVPMFFPVFTPQLWGGIWDLHGVSPAGCQY